MRSRDRITLSAGGAAVALGVLAIGGASRWVVIALCGLAAIAAAGQVTSRRRLGRISPLLVLIGAVVALTAIQLIPLPEATVAHLEPAGHELVRDSQQLLHHDRGWYPLSMDPSATRVELAKLAAYLLIAWMALRAAASERGRQRLLSAVAGVAGLVALIGIVHEVVGADRLFGVYEPVHLTPVVMAPLLNANHLACLMSLGAIVAGGLAFHERRSPSVRAMWILVTLLCIGVGLSTRSRGGVMGLAAGTTITAVVIVLQRLREAGQAKRKDVLRVAVPAAVVVLCSLVLVIFLGGGEVRHDLETTHLAELSDPRSKYAAWESSIELIEEAPVLGIGRGAFETAFTRVHPASSQLTFSHVENEYLQAVVDWGVLGGIAIALAGGFAVLVALRRWRNGSLGASAIGGLTAVAVHSLVDFGLELPGVAIPTIIVAATVLYVPLKETGRSRLRTGLRAGVVAAVVAAGVLALLPGSRTLGEDHEELDDDDVTLADAQAILDRHPLDYLAAAYVARESKDATTQLAFLNFALRLHPTHPGLHRTIARWLAQSHKIAQATLEYRIAITGTNDPTQLVGEVLELFPATNDAIAALPADEVHWAGIVNVLVGAKRNDVALAYLEKLVDARGAKPSADVWRKLSALATAAGDLKVGERAATELAKLEPVVANMTALAAIQITRKEFDAAEATLAPVVAEPVTSPEHVEAHLQLCDLEIARPDWTKARTCLTESLVLPGVTMVQRRKIHGRLAKVEEALGNKERAQFERSLAEPGTGAGAGAGAGAGTSESSSKLDGSGQLR